MAKIYAETSCFRHGRVPLSAIETGCGDMAKAKRAAIYLRVSTDDQTVENQRRELTAAATARGWTVVAEYADEGISGAKGRDGRPQLDLLLKDTVHRRFDVAMVWAVDRLGRSLPDLIASMQELHGAKVDLFLHQQGIDTTTPGGKAMFQMLGVFGEFERAMIQARVKAGMSRAMEEQSAGKVRIGADGKRRKDIGRPRVSVDTEKAIRARLAAGVGILKIASELGVGSGTVQRIKRGA
jgi:DNA invertase Pin-like site-specific DNA recombinase